MELALGAMDSWIVRGQAQRRLVSAAAMLRGLTTDSPPAHSDYGGDDFFSFPFCPSVAFYL